MIFSFITLQLSAQQPAQYDTAQTNWYFGGGCGMDVSVYPPTQLTGGMTGASVKITQEGTATVSHNGRMLFYTDGKYIWNHNHQLMAGGETPADTLMGGQSATQSSMIIPFAGHPGSYFVFTLDDFLHGLVNGLRVTKVLMCADDSLGTIDTTYRNVLLASNMGEKMCAIHQKNNDGYWVLTHAITSDSFYCYPVTSDGVGDPIISKTGSIHDSTYSAPEYALGEMKFAPNGEYGALAVGNTPYSRIELFDFDTATGIVSNGRSVTQAVPGGVTRNFYGVCFSANSCNLFVTDLMQTELWWYNMCAGSDSLIQASRTLLYTFHITTGGLERAPNGVVYCVYSSGYYTSSGVAAIEHADTYPVVRDSIVSFASNYIGLCYFIDDYSYPVDAFPCELATDVETQDIQTSSAEPTVRKLYDLNGIEQPIADRGRLAAGYYLLVTESKHKRTVKKLVLVH